MAERLVNDIVATILVFDNMVKQLAVLYILLENRPDIQEKMVNPHEREFVRILRVVFCEKRKCLGLIWDYNAILCHESQKKTTLM